MAHVQSTAEKSPVFHEDVLPVALRALHRGEAMGFTAAEDDVSDRAIAAFIDELWKERIGQKDVATLKTYFIGTRFDPVRVREAFRGIYDALGENPVPRREWRALRAYFDDDRLASLLGISESSVQRYARGTRVTPDPIVARLHWLALVVGHLNGSYNEYGVRRWFARPRKALGGRSPQETLLADGDWSPDGEAARRVGSLAEAGMGMTAT